MVNLLLCASVVVARKKAWYMLHTFTTRGIQSFFPHKPQPICCNNAFGPSGTWYHYKSNIMLINLIKLVTKGGWWRKWKSSTERFCPHPRDQWRQGASETFHHRYITMGLSSMIIWIKIRHHMMSSQMEEDEMENFMRLVDDNGEISKHDLIIQACNTFIMTKLPS